MKVIVSHDVDHLTFSEHWRDSVVPKYIARGFLEAMGGSSTFTAFGRRLHRLGANRAHSLDALAAFDLDHEVPATFFFAAARGRDLAYAPAAVGPLLRNIAGQGFEVGVHAIAFDRLERIEREKSAFEKMVGFPAIGARLHNVGMAENAERLTTTYAHLFAQAGFTYVSNTYAVRDPYRVGGLWELPVLITEGYAFRNRSRIVNRSLKEAQAFTLRRLDEAERAGLRYASVLFHDVYFDPAFAPLDDWYRWLVAELQRREWPFCSCREALAELESE